MELIEKILNFYLSFKDTINLNLYTFALVFTFISVIWISTIGIVTPILLISALAFGYYGIFISLVSLLFGSIINFLLARKTKSMLKKIKNKQPIFNNEPFISYIIFRLIPGIPYLVKNLSAVFFKLNFKKFYFAVLISDTPQIIIFTFFFKSLVDSSNILLISQDYHLIFKQMFLPTISIIIFLVFIFYIKKIRENVNFKNKNKNLD